MKHNMKKLIDNDSILIEKVKVERQQELVAKGI